MKLEIVLDDPEARAVWETVQRAKAEIEAWPSWKREWIDSSVALDPIGGPERVTDASAGT